MTEKSQKLTPAQEELFRQYIAGLASPYDKTAEELVLEVRERLGLDMTYFQVSKYRNKITGRSAAKRTLKETPAPAVSTTSSVPMETQTYKAKLEELRQFHFGREGLIFLGNADKPTRMRVTGVHGGNVQGYVELTPMSGHTKVAVYSSYVSKSRPHDRDILLGADLVAVLFNPALIEAV
jgi:hypothetical protein